MIQVTLRGNTTNKVITIDPSVPVKQILEENNMLSAAGVPTIDGVFLTIEQLNGSFSDLGITDKCFLCNIVKADNANA